MFRFLFFSKIDDYDPEIVYCSDPLIYSLVMSNEFSSWRSYDFNKSCQYAKRYHESVGFEFSHYCINIDYFNIDMNHEYVSRCFKEDKTCF